MWQFLIFYFTIFLPVQVMCPVAALMSFFRKESLSMATQVSLFAADIQNNLWLHFFSKISFHKSDLQKTRGMRYPKLPQQQNYDPYVSSEWPVDRGFD